ncbi:MAG: hypothetical protein IPG99_15345 [Ignavibacteria bacterium]|nr:hypothetical protein [Ignavibacteria bacterium]
MISILKENSVDCILSFYLLNAGYRLLFFFLQENFQIPLIAGIRNDIGRNIFNVERFGVIRWVVNGATNIVWVNEHLKRNYFWHFLDASNKTTVISNG